jgi:ribosome-associated translation inhibitor RaiA
MRIRVSNIDTPISDETHAYAEYRVFTAIAPYERSICAVNVSVGRSAASDSQFVCTLTVDLARSGQVKTQARAAHPHAAIDRAADRIASLVGRRVGSDFSLKSPAYSS